VELLGRHVGQLAFEEAGIGSPAVAGDLGDAEVEDAAHAVGGDEQVLGRDVAVDDRQRGAVDVAERVGVVQALACLGEDAGGEGQAARVARRGGGEGVPGDAVEVLHDQVELAAVLAQLEDRAQVGVGEARGDTALVEEHLDERRVDGEVGEDLLDREQPGEIHLLAAA